MVDNNLVGGFHNGEGGHMLELLDSQLHSLRRRRTANAADMATGQQAALAVQDPGAGCSDGQDGRRQVGRRGYGGQTPGD